MHRKHNRQLSATDAICAATAAQHRRIIDIGRAVHRDDRVAVFGQAKLLAVAALGDRPPQHLERVDHDIADAFDLSGATPSRREIVVGVGRRGPQQIGDRVGDEPVDLLRHRPVAAAQPGFEMGELQAEFFRDQRAGGGRVDVADNDDPAGRVLDTDTFIASMTPAVCSA